MHIVHRPVRRREERRMYLPSDRLVVNGVGLGAVDGFNIGKMFKRMVTITPGSFKLKNIMGAIGSVSGTLMTGGLGPALAPKTFGAHSKAMKTLGTVAVAAGATATAVMSAPYVMSAGKAIAGKLGVTGGELLKGAGSLFKSATSMFGGKGGGGQTEQFGPMQPTQADMAAQAEYARQVDAYNRQQQMLAAQQQLLPQTEYPTMSAPGVAYSAGTDMRMTSPYSPLADESAMEMIDPNTGQVIMPSPVAQAGMLPELSTGTWLAIGGVTLAGVFLMSGRKE